MIRFYGYAKCDTCRRARQWLQQRGLVHEFIDITASPPPKSLLRELLAPATGLRLRDLFNTSGQAYRELGIKDRLPEMTAAEAVDLLASNGRLCKRPVVSDGRRHTVGFREESFAEVWGGD